MEPRSEEVVPKKWNNELDELSLLMGSAISENCSATFAATFATFASAIHTPSPVRLDNVSGKIVVGTVLLLMIM